VFETARVLLGRTRQFFVEYVNFFYTGGVVHVWGHVRALPRPESRLAAFGLLGAALTIVATPILVHLGPQWSVLQFVDAENRPQVVPAAALFIAIPLFALAWGYLLSGAAQGPGLLWISLSLFFMFITGVIGFAIPLKSPLANAHLVIYCMPVILGALTPGGRMWGKLALAVFAAGIAMRATPVPDFFPTIPWRLLWIPASLVMIGLHLLIARRPWTSTAGRVAVSAGTTTLYLFFVTWRASPATVAETLNYALTLSYSLIDSLWFILGASFVAGAIALGAFVRRLAGMLASEPAPVWGPLVGWGVAMAWLKPQQVAAPGLYWVAGLMVGGLIAMTARWITRGMSSDWLARWLVVSVAAVVVAQTYLTLDIRDVLARGAGALSVVIFVYSLTVEVAGHITKVPLSIYGLEQPAPLVLYLGVVLLVGASTLFSLAANLVVYQQEIVLFEYLGTVSLWIPIGLMTLAHDLPGLRREAMARVAPAFVWAAVLAVPGFLLHADIAPSLAAAVNIAAAAVLAVVLVRRWRDVRGAISGALIGAAVALGFAISLHRRVLIGVVSMMMTAIAGFTRDQPLRAAAQRILYQAFPGRGADLDVFVPWQSRDTLVYYVVGTLAVTGIAAAFSAAAARARGFQ
jgi:hypothetical protein